MGAYMIWWTRYAVTMPVYAANRVYALKTARDKQEALTKEFARKNNLDPDFIYESFWSGGTPPKLEDLVAWFRRLDEFLESEAQSQCATQTFAVNKSLSTIVIDIGLNTDYGKDVY